MFWVFIAVWAFLQLRQVGATLSWGAGFSCCRAWDLGTRGPAAAAGGLNGCSSRPPEHRLSVCLWPTAATTRMRGPPWPVSPALAGGLFTTQPPEKLGLSVLNTHFYDYSEQHFLSHIWMWYLTQVCRYSIWHFWLFFAFIILPLCFSPTRDIL